ncbi:MAG: head-tail adaptor protein [Pseudomonadota bacterium]
MIGALRFQIDILSATNAGDEAGGRAVSYAPVATVWSAVDQLSSVVASEGARTQRLKRIKAYVRNRSDFALGGRIRHQGVDYEIVSIESDDERGRRVFLICEEVAK